MNRLSTDLADYEYDNQILVVNPKSGIVLDKDDMVIMLNEAVNFTSGEKYYALIDTSNHVETTVEGRNYYSTSELSKYRFADAFLVNSLAIKLVVNFYIKFNKPHVLTKMFNTKADALNWLLEVKNNSNKTR